MSYLVFCTFDLKNASSTDYDSAYAALEKLGLKKVQKSNKGNDVVIPTTSAMGELDGTTASELRIQIVEKIKAAFKALGLKSEIFVTVGGSWSWGSGTT